jgi:hypothetical protein
MFASCAAAPFGVAIFLVLAPLALFVAYTPVESLGHWPWVAAGVVFAAVWAFLYITALRERVAMQRWAED